MSKHLIIGLGGTGGNVICELRKRIYEQYNNIEPTAKDTYIEYLYVDSSKEDLLGLDKEGKPLQKFFDKWSALGNSVALSPAQTLFIGGMEAEKLQNLHNYNNLNSFFTEQDKEDTAKGLGQIVGAGIGGQRRRFGRMLFSNNATSDNSFCPKVQARVQCLLDKGRAHGDNMGNVTFHICAGLGGGTGSGTVIDAIAQIRKMFPQDGNEDRYRICLYLYVPEALKNHERDKEGYYRPNGYAALNELNALSVGRYLPIDVTDTRDIPAEEKRIKNAGFEAAYIYTNRNLVGNQYDLNELPKITADFLYQKLFAGISARFESNENVGSSPEEQNGVPVRSRRFLTFGIKRLIYPEVEIHEYAAYRFAATAALQMVYGWPQGANYPSELTDERVNVSTNDVKGRDDSFPMRQTLHLTDALLKLDTDYFARYTDLAQRAKWSSFKDYWQGASGKLYTRITTTMSKDQWLTKYNKEMGTLYSQYFRGNGVATFFKNCCDDKAFLADEIANHIGNYLLGEWKEGRRSLAEVEKFLTLLQENCRERAEGYDEAMVKAANTAQKLRKEAQVIGEEFVNRGILTDLLGRSTKTFEKYTQYMYRSYIMLTEKAAYEFAKIMMGEIIDRLALLTDSVTQFKLAMLTYLETQKDYAEAKCQKDDGGYKSDSEVVKLYAPEEVRNLVDKFIHEESKQNEYITALRQKVASSVEDNSHFLGLAKKLSKANHIESAINNVCRKNASTRINDYTYEDATQRLLNVNILEKLRQYENWGEYIDRMCNDALILIEKDNLQTGADDRSSTMVQLGLPRFDEDQDFYDKVKERVENTLAGVGYNNLSIYETDNSQLVVLTGKNSFTLRHVRTVAKLKESYDEFVKNDVCAYKIVHTESFRRPLPPLYPKTTEELRNELYRILLLAYNIPGIIDTAVDGETGEENDAVPLKGTGSRQYCYNRMDRPDDIASDYIYLGKGIRKAMEYLTKKEDYTTMLDELTREQLATKYKHNAKKQELTATIKTFLKNILSEEFDNDQTNRELLAYVSAADNLFEEELKLK